ncbi:MAG: hypothetical protein IPI19_09170 [Ignavibacteriales bacterium]|nr:hypothetical protein [Ignavibacteriales bacterium]
MRNYIKTSIVNSLFKKIPVQAGIFFTLILKTRPASFTIASEYFTIAKARFTITSAYFTIANEVYNPPPFFSTPPPPPPLNSAS